MMRRNPMLALKAGALLRRAATTGARTSGEQLQLWLPAKGAREDAPIVWRRITADGRALAGRQQGLAGLAPAPHIIVWTPAAATVLLRARLPTRATAKILQALPYALEDHLIEPPDRQHFVFAQEPDGGLAVAVTARERMDAWLAALKAAGLRPDVLAPVTLSLPYFGDAWTLAFSDDEIVLRTGARAGAGGVRDASASAAPPAWLLLALDEARAEGRAPRRILLVDPPADLDRVAWAQALDRRAGGAEVAGLPPVAGLDPALDPASGAAPALEDLAPGAREQGAALAMTAGLNLLQHRYAPSGQWQGIWRAYRPAAILLAVWLGGMLVVDTAELVRLSRAVSAADERMRELLLKSFPDTTAVLDAPRQMQRGVDQLLARGAAIAPSDLLALLARAAPILEREPRVQVQALEYADGQLVVRFNAEPSAVATTLLPMLRARALDVELQKPDAGGTAAGEMRLRLRASGADAPPRAP